MAADLTNRGFRTRVSRCDDYGVIIELSAPLQPSVWVDVGRDYKTERFRVRLNCGTTGDGDTAKARRLVALLNAGIQVADFLTSRIVETPCGAE